MLSHLKKLEHLAVLIRRDANIMKNKDGLGDTGGCSEEGKGVSTAKLTKSHRLSAEQQRCYFLTASSDPPRSLVVRQASVISDKSKTCNGIYWVP